MIYEDLLQYKILLYKTGKYQQDFETFFDDLDIVGYIDEDSKVDKLNERSVYNVSNLNIDLHTKIIICSFEHEDIRKRLASIGLEEGKDFFTGEDILKLLDNEQTNVYEVPKNKKLIVFGTGAISTEFILTYNNNLDIEYFVDNNPKVWGTFFCGKNIKDPNELLREKPGEFFVIVCTSATLEIKKQLISMNCKHIRDFEFYCRIMPKPSELIKKTIMDERKTRFVCSVPFETVSIQSSGDIHICTCGKIVGFAVGNLLFQTFKDVWNSIYAKIFRFSIINGTYSFCNSEFCNLSGDELKNEQADRDGQKMKTMAEDYPIYANLSYDNSCNLVCRSCRRARIATLDSKNETAKAVHDKVVSELLPHMCNPNNILYAAGNGDPFFSKYYGEAIKNYKGGKLIIQTNGMLFNEKNWLELRRHYKHQIEVNISVDATTEEVFLKLRGGDFKVLLNNLEFAGSLRKNGDISYYELDFVVQKDNFRQMIDFIYLAQSFNADKIQFLKMFNMGSFSEEEYNVQCVFDKAHPDYDEFVNLIHDNRFKSKEVDLSSLL